MPLICKSLRLEASLRGYFNSHIEERRVYSIGTTITCYFPHTKYKKLSNNWLLSSSQGRHQIACHKLQKGVQDITIDEWKEAYQCEQYAQEGVCKTYISLSSLDIRSSN